MRLRNGKFVGKLMIDVGVNSKDIREKDKLFDISRVITPRKPANKKKFKIFLNIIKVF